MADNSTTMIGGGRPIRPCIGCGAMDDHPRCQVQVGPGENDWTYWHPDCHQMTHGDADCHAQCNGNASPGPGVDMLQAISEHHQAAQAVATSGSARDGD